MKIRKPIIIAGLWVAWTEGASLRQRNIHESTSNSKSSSSVQDAPLAPPPPPPSSNSTTTTTEEELLKSLIQRMQPKPLNLTYNPNTNRTEATLHQFYHLHHMKTGGTSLSSLLSCALHRAQSTRTFYSTTARLSECAYSSFQSCLSNPNDPCRSSISSAATMTYCAPLFAAHEFGWGDADAITMLRHPVDRVWSMFRFQTKSCYRCRNLTEVYDEMDEYGVHSFDGVCGMQIQNHLTRNLQTYSDEVTRGMTEEERFRLALENLRHSFSVVGLLERLEESLALFSHVFPWMAERVDGSDTTCPFPHHNSSPGNNRCGPGGSHWELPEEPDEETRRVIEEHNRLDIKLYEAAVQHFELQLMAVQQDDVDER